MRSLKIMFIASVLLLTCISISNASVRIVAALPDFGSIASAIGGNHVTVSSIGKAVSNPHNVEVFPSSMAAVSKADVYLKSGLGLDQWSDDIIDGSRNNRLRVVDCSTGIKVLEKPVKVDASMGDVHPFGNPHYWLDPGNGIVIGKNILSALLIADPMNRTDYEKNYSDFSKDCETRFQVWLKKMKGLEGKKIITYHSSWAYFADAFNLSIADHIEPFPGIPPTGKHLAYLVEIIKKEKVALVMKETYFPSDATRFLNRQTDIKICVLSPSCSDIKAESYLSHFDEITDMLLSGEKGRL